MTKPRTADLDRKQGERDRAYLTRERSIEQQEADATLPRAPSNDPCCKCGIPGFRGCKHQRPHVAEAPRGMAPKQGRRRSLTKSWYD